jgi:hypothetical protein
MMDGTSLMGWVGPALDVAALALLAAVVWGLRRVRDPGAAWAEREARLQAIFEDLRALVAQSEGLARDLDGKLAGREERLKALLADAERAIVAPASAAATTASAIARPRPARVEVREDEPTATARTIERLLDEGVDADDIGRRLGVPVAEVRLVAGLKAARAARRRVAQETAAHA